MPKKSAYQQMPRKAYRLRLALVLAPLLGLALLGAGAAGRSELNPLSRAEGSAFRAPLSFYSIYFSAWTNAPDGCISGEMHSDFQRERCLGFWSQIAQASVIALAPLALLWTGYLFGMDSLNLTYRRIRKRLGSKKAVAKGVVTSPAVAGNDFFGWLYGFRAISVEVAKGSQLRVYFSAESRLPLPGDSVAIFSTGKSLGRERFFGTYYAPHVAVIAGMTQD